MTRSACLSVVSILLLSAMASAKNPPAVESLLPSTTKGFLSVPNVEKLRAQWEKTQLGQLAKDPAMKAFAEDLQRQLEARLNQGGVQLRITFDDLRELCTGEFCLAAIQPDNDPKQHASVWIVDIAGHQKAAEKLLDKVEQELIREGSRKTVSTVSGVTLTSYVLPKRKGDTEIRRALYFVRDDRLVATNDEAVAKYVLARFDNAADDTLDKWPSFQGVMKGARTADMAQPQVRWYMAPFGLAEVARAAAGGRKKRGTDMLKVLVNQGFGAVRTVGGYVFLMDGDHELTHRSFIYAPAVEKTPEKYQLAARMLNFPNTTQLAPESWVPREVATYLTFSWKMQEAFEYAKTLVDEAAGAPVFDDILDSLLQDPNGPRVDIRKDLVAHLGQRATLFTDYREPITTTSERWFAAVEVTDPKTVAQTVDKAMKNDPQAKKRLLGEQVIWEIVVEEDSAAVEKVKVKVATPGFGQPAEEEEREINPLLKHAAITVAHGHLMVASHVDFMEQVLSKAGVAAGLGTTKDFQVVNDALTKLGAGSNSARFFVRTDKGHHPTYELIRQGKMPEAETIFGSVLNRLLGSEEEGVVREQQIKGDKMPPYEKVRGHLGPGGLFITAQDNGWQVIGCLLKKTTAATATTTKSPAGAESPKPKAAPKAAPTPTPKAKSKATPTPKATLKVTPKS